jgi:peptidoglycan hydrolase CwlO-like protein
MHTYGTSSRRASNALAPARTVTRRDAFRLLIGAGALAFVSPVAAFATSQSDIDAAQSDVDAAQAQLDQIGQEVSDLSSKLSDTVGQIDDISAQIDQTQADIDAKEADIEAKQKDIDSKQDEIEQKQEVLGQRMSAAFKSGNASTIDLLLSSASFEELTSNIYYLDKVSEQDNSMIEDVKSLKADLETQKAQLEDDKATLETKQADLTSQKDQLNQLKSDQESQLADVQAKQQEAQNLVDKLNSNVQSLIDQRNVELLAAQEEARRVASYSSSKSSSGGSAGGSANISSGTSGSQAAVISAAYSTGSTGAGFCAAWVSNVFANAGVGTFYGNACDMYWAYCSSSNRSSIQAGMIIAVPTEPYSAAARLYGHIGIYVGNGTVRHCASGVVMTQSLDSWISEFGVTSTPRWGWLGGVALA